MDDVYEVNLAFISYTFRVSMVEDCFFIIISIKDL